MAQGTLTLFEEFSLDIGDGTHELDAGTYKVALISNTTVAVASQTAPSITTYTQVAGGNGYTTGGESITCTWTEVGGTATFQVTSGNTSWTQNGSGPTNIYQAIIYDDLLAGDDAIAFIDMTADSGTTPISLQDGDITITWNPNIFTLS